MTNGTSRFMTIRQTAATGIASEHFLRRLKTLGLLPGVSVGNRFKVNYPLLIEALQTASLDPRHKVEELRKW